MPRRTTLRHRRVGLPMRLMCLGMSLAALCTIRPAMGAPGDIFTLSAPVIGADPPKETPIQDGDASVSTQTGALTYSYPIQVPPGRGGMQPHLSLAYSSQAPIYGGVAAGWSLSIPIITLDTNDGRLVSTITLPAVKHYQSSMAGNRPLLAVTEPAGAGMSPYRAQNDSSYTRYERNSSGTGYWWRAYATDGTTYYFGDTDSHTTGCTTISDEYAPLTRAVDSFGNQIDYYYRPGVTGECRIDNITWGENSNAGQGVFAQVAFGYAATPPVCVGVPVGSQTSYRSGTAIVTGASELDTITASIPTTPPQYQRVITLTYSSADASCTATHAAFRSLSSIQESAWGTDSPRVDLPPVSFTYGSANFGTGGLAYPAEVDATIPWLPNDSNVVTRYNLGWGYRFEDGKWPTVEAMMLDVDGDGLLDRVINAPSYDGAGHVTKCGAKWQRNLGGLTFGPQQTIQLPTLKWATPSGPPYNSDPNYPFQGGAFANAYSGLLDEGCALNYQQTSYRNSTGGSGIPLQCAPDHSSCPASGYCSDGSDCTGKSLGPHDTILAYRWTDLDGDGLVDIVASPVQGGLVSYNLQRGNGVPGYVSPPAEPTLFGPVPWINSFPCPNPPYSADPYGPYTMCNGMYPWFVYKNHGNGVFGTQIVVGAGPLMGPDKILYQPIPLETTSGDSSLTSAMGGQTQASFDIDGDGFPDAVYEPPGDTSGTNWSVFRNDHTGKLVAAVGATPFLFGKQAFDIFYLTHVEPGQSTPLIEYSGLIDLNGDGLVDHWSRSGAADDTQASIDLNDGLRFVLQQSLSRRPGTDAVPTYPPCVGQCFIGTGTRVESSRVSDVDLDGRQDAVQVPPGAWPATATTYFNQGGVFGAAAGLLQDGFAQIHTMAATDLIPYYASPAPSPTYSWELRSDLIDLDGDGIPEGVNVPTTGINGESGNSQRLMLSRIATPTQPPRLMVGIDNHRGATTSIRYASMANHAVVKQDVSLGKVTPHSEWVVDSVTTTDALSTTPTTSTTSYYYVYPHFSPDIDQPHSAAAPGRYAMRGFEEVDTTHPSGSKTIERYDYAVDFSGRLKSTLLMPAEAPSDVRKIDETTWQALTLFGGIRTYHPSSTTHFTCLDGQNEAACRATPAAYTKTTPTFTALTSTTSSGGPALLYAETSSLLQGGTTPNPPPTDGDRQTLTSYAFNADATTYRLRPLATTKQVRTSGAMTTFAKSAQTWDSTYRVPLTSETWVDGSDTTRLISHSAYDMTTGNVVQHWKPKQNAANTTSTTFTYDAKKLYPVTEVNELGHRRDFIYEYGTGTKLETDGPNVRTCTTTCPPPDPLSPTKEVHKVRVDGLGREIERWDTTSDDGSIYTLNQMATTAYVDSIVAGNPTSVAANTKLDSAGTMWKRERTDLDGHGRPVKKIVFAQGSAPADQVTSFEYANDGTLKTVRLPDPTANDASTVLYTYTFDSLGRPKSIRRPDATQAASQSGVDMAYNGVTTTTTEFVGAAGGQQAVTKTIADAFGRTVTVQEQVGGTPPWATTNYTFSADDNVRTITDPEGVLTTLTHDFAGRRTRIDRAGNRSWLYSYDANGNMVSEQVPGSPAISFTTSVAYDDLDRPVSKVIGDRGLSAADRTLFGSSTESYTWDAGGNHVGYLRYWKAFAPSASTPMITVDTANNNQGARTLTTETMTVAGYPQLSRQLRQDYFLFGGVRNTVYNDFVGAGTRVTSSAMVYDLRGLPQRIDLIRSGEAGLHVALQTRNVAGLVTKRRTDLTGSPMTFIESNWTYDKLGRVASQVVQKAPGPSTVVRQDLSYFGNDDPKTLDHYLGANHKQLQFGYDLRHQLTSATEVTTPGYFGATYQYGTAGRFTRATETTNSPPNSDVVPRNVDYLYQGADPEEVTALRTVNNGPIIASYAYDLAGNQTSRVDATGDRFEFIYDGKDQLRRVTKKNPSGAIQGSEEYWYDGTGQRFAVVKRDSANLKTEMLWFIGDVEAHYDPTGAVSHVYSHLAMGTPVARIDRTTDASTSLEFQFHGLSNNTIAAVDQGGMINASLSYAPFGELIEGTDSIGGGGLSSHVRRLNDKFTDSLSGLTYYGFRFYDQTLINWTQSDPLFRMWPEGVGRNPRRSLLYSFSQNNPLRYRDPDGRITVQGILDWGIETGKSLAAEGGAWAELGGVVITGTAVLAVTVTVGETIVEPVPTPWNLAEPTTPSGEGGGDTSGTGDAPVEPPEIPGANLPLPEVPIVPKPDKEWTPEEYWPNKKAPTQVTPGTREIVDKDKPSSHPHTPPYDRTSIYDEFGRQIGQDHPTDHGYPHDHPNPHHHDRDPKTGQRSGPKPGPHPKKSPPPEPKNQPKADVPKKPS